jgi:hypothetical protein
VMGRSRGVSHRHIRDADWPTGEDSQASILDTSGYLRVLHFLDAVKVSSRYRLHSSNPIISFPWMFDLVYSQFPSIQNSLHSTRHCLIVTPLYHVRLLGESGKPTGLALVYRGMTLFRSAGSTDLFPILSPRWAVSMARVL